MNNFPLNVTGTPVNVTTAGVVIDIPTHVSDVIIYNAGPDTLYAKSGGPGLTAGDVAEAAYPMAINPGEKGAYGVIGNSKLALRAESVDRALVVWFGTGA